MTRTHRLLKSAFPPPGPFFASAAAFAFVLLTNCGLANTVAYWRFENGVPNSVASGVGTILDSSGNNLNGTPINEPVYRGNVAASPVPLTGATNTLSMEFNGVNQRVFVPDDPAFQLTQSLTLEAFVNARPILDPNYEGEIIFRGDDRGGLDPYSLAALPNGNFEFRVWSATDTVGIQAPIPSYDVWHHVAGTLDDATGEMKLYVDGLVAASTVTSVRPLGPLDPGWTPGLGVGDVQSDSYPVHFNGLIDEARISDVALSPSQMLVNVPEPSSLMLIALGAFGLRLVVSRVLAPRAA